MLLAHAVAFAEARTYLAALADTAATLPASLSYESTLLHLDAIHGDIVPLLDATAMTVDAATLHAVAEAAVADLTEHGIDALQVELVLAMLHDARALDAPT